MLLTHREMEDTLEIYKYQIFYDSRYNKWECSTNFGDYNDDDDDPNPNPNPNFDPDPNSFVPADFKPSNAPMPSDQV